MTFLDEKEQERVSESRMKAQRERDSRDQQLKEEKRRKRALEKAEAA